MEDIIEAALHDVEETEWTVSDDAADADEFGLPSCALVGWGSAGIDRVERMDEADSTAVIGELSVLGRATGNVGVRIPVGETDICGELQPLDHPDFASALDDAVATADLVVVTGHLESTASVRLLETISRQLPAAPTVLVVPSIPREGLSDDSKSALLDVVDTVGTTVPFDLSRIVDAFHRAATAQDDDPIEIANRLVVEWLEDVFETVQGPIAAGRCDQRSIMYELLEDGGISLLYWGWGTREDDAEALIEHAASHRFCDGNRQTATGGFGFVRFGHEFTLEEFESLEAATRRHLRADGVEDDGWLVCGDSILTFSDECRLAHLVVDVEAESLAFL